MVLRGVLVGVGVVAVVFGLQGVVQGADEVLGGGGRGRGPTDDSVESEFRFYAAWYAVAGVLALWASRRVGTDESRFVVRLLAGGAALGATGRVIALATIGWPHRLYVALLVVEYAIAVGLLALQAAADT